MLYDLAILGDPNNDQPTLAIANEANDGLYKLLQKVMILLLTDESSPYNLGVGTSLPTEVVSANITDKKAVQGLFKIGMAKIREVIHVQTPFDAPDDEKLKDFDVVVLDGEAADTLDVEITVTSVADGSISVRMPTSNLFTSQE